MLNFNQAIQQRLDEILSQDEKSLLFGLGVTDPKRFFGTCNSLLEKYGPNRIWECPTSENSYLGHAFGLALAGYKPIVHFQRMDFMLYAFDQLINIISKWQFMFSCSQPTHLVMRTLIGHGWGQGAQHSQNFSAFFAQEPGLTVIAPSCPKSASCLLQQSFDLQRPVIFIEHRWLQYLTQSPEQYQNLDFKIGSSCIRKPGSQITILAWSYSVVEALRFCQLFPNIDFEVVDLLSLSPLDMDGIKNSFSKTNQLIIWEPTRSFGSLGSEIISQLHSEGYNGKILKIGNNYNYPSASPHEIFEHYPSLDHIVKRINQHFSLDLKISSQMRWPRDKDFTDWTPWH